MVAGEVSESRLVRIQTFDATGNLSARRRPEGNGLKRYTRGILGTRLCWDTDMADALSSMLEVAWTGRGESCPSAVALFTEFAQGRLNAHSDGLYLRSTSRKVTSPDLPPSTNKPSRYAQRLERKSGGSQSIFREPCMTQSSTILQRKPEEGEEGRASSSRCPISTSPWSVSRHVPSMENDRSLVANEVENVSRCLPVARCHIVIVPPVDAASSRLSCEKAVVVIASL